MSEVIAIVIPAFKALYLRDTLLSFAKQTNQRFRLYIGDDASPENLENICHEFSTKINLVYHRFESNIGATSLVAQWNRCVQLCREPWVWLFSDDDIADENCVEEFYQTLEETRAQYDVYHFDVTTIDRYGNKYRELEAYGDTLTSLQFINKRLQYQISSYAVEYIFSRQAFERENGFVEFPAAWCSDDASWAAFSGMKSIKTISRAKVHWRQSGVNISSADSPYKREKIIAAVDYLEWVRSRYEGQLHHAQGDKPIQSFFRTWFYTQLYQINPLLGAKNILSLARRVSRLTGSPFSHELLRFIRSELRALMRNLKSDFSSN